MEVILKKTKISNTILNQTIKSTISDLKSFDVLGWCMGKNGKFIVLYNPDTNQLRKYLMFNEVTVENKYRDNVNNISYDIKISYGSGYVPIYYVTTSEIEKDEIVNTLKNVKQIAESKNQFFL